MIGAIFHLIRPRLLVLLDRLVEVLGHRGAGHQPSLSVRPHALRVDVEARRGLGAKEPPSLELAQRPGALGVHLVGVLVGALGQGDLRAGDLEEAVGVAGGQRPGLLGADHVIRRRRHADGVGGGRAQSPKGKKLSHGGFYHARGRPLRRARKHRP